jgi:hypothetical protein
LEIKTNAIYQLLRNFSIDQQLVRNVRVVVTELGNRIIAVKVLRDHQTFSNENEEEIVLPCITFFYVIISGQTLLCRQFPLALAYSTTIHNCQGQTYDRIDIDLTKSVFTHGQLYTALSRVRTTTQFVWNLIKLQQQMSRIMKFFYLLYKTTVVVFSLIYF